MGFILIGGCPRSGTGALANLLTLDGQCFVSLEFSTFSLWNSRGFGPRIRTSDTRNRHTRNMVVRSGLLTSDDFNRLQQQCSTGEEFYKGFIKACRQKIEYFGDKQPDCYLHRMDSFLKQFPKSKGIITIRHPVDVICSYIKRSNINFNPDKAGEKISKALSVWNRSAHGFIRLLNNKNILKIKYEDAVGDVSGTLNLLTKFLRLKRGIENRDNYYKPVHLKDRTINGTDIEGLSYPKFDKKTMERMKVLGYK